MEYENDIGYRIPSNTGAPYIWQPILITPVPFQACY